MTLRIGYRAEQTIFNQILEKYKESNNPTVLKHIISSFKPDLIAKNSRTIVTLIREADEEILPKVISFS
jgi:hypothetical protein